MKKNNYEYLKICIFVKKRNMSSIVINLEQSMEKSIIEKIKKMIGVKSVSKPLAEIDKITLLSQENLS